MTAKDKIDAALRDGHEPFAPEVFRTEIERMVDEAIMPEMSKNKQLPLPKEARDAIRTETIDALLWEKEKEYYGIFDNILLPFENEEVIDMLDDIVSKNYDVVEDIKKYHLEITLEVTEDCEDIDADTCFGVWLCAMLIDSALGGTSFQGATGQFYGAVERVKDALEKKKLLTRKPVHSRSELCALTVRALDAIQKYSAEISKDLAREPADYRRWLDEVDACKSRLARYGDN